MFQYQNNQMLTQAREAKFQPKWILQILLFIAIFFATNTVSSTIMIFPILFGTFTDPELLAIIASGDPIAAMDAATTASMAILEKPWVVLCSLFTTAITTLFCFLYCCKIEKRSVASMGFRKAGWLSRYLKGYAIGTAMLLLCALVLLLMGQLDFAFAQKIPVFYISLFFVGFLIQGMSEEVLVRGYFMVSLNNRCSTAAAVGISSVAFALLHSFNPGLTLLAMLNLTLFGVFMAVYILRTDDLWGACAIHSAWNFAQGNLVGIQVSGMAHLPTVTVMTPTTERALFHGGSFGLEGGLIVTLMLLAVIALTLFLPKKEQAVVSA